MNRALVVAAVAAVSGLGVGPASVIPGLAGVYKHRFTNALVSGERYPSENILEIVPTAPGAAYVRVHLEYYNGHACNLWGIARERDRALVYRERRATPGARVCELRVERVGRDVRLDDGDGSCHAAHCGMRGSLSDVRFAAASRRKIRYMARLKASEQYREAVAEDAQASR